MNFRPVTLKKELGDFSKFYDPGYAKKLKKWEIYTKFISGSKQPKKLENTSATPFFEVSDEFQAGNSQKRTWWFIKKVHDPGYAKKLKKWEIYTKFIFGSKQPKKLWNTSATPFLKFPMNFKLVTLKKELSDLSKKCMTPDMQKNSKNKKFMQNFFFASNNLKSFKIRPQHHLWSFRWISGP